MDLGIIIFSEISQTKIVHHLNVQSKKKGYKWTYLGNGKRLTDIENKIMVTEGDREDGFWDVGGEIN